MAPVHDPKHPQPHRMTQDVYEAVLARVYTSDYASRILGRAMRVTIQRFGGATAIVCTPRYGTGEAFFLKLEPDLKAPNATIVKTTDLHVDSWLHSIRDDVQTMVPAWPSPDQLLL